MNLSLLWLHFFFYHYEFERKLIFFRHHLKKNIVSVQASCVKAGGGQKCGSHTTGYVRVRALFSSNVRKMRANMLCISPVVGN